VTAVVAIGLRSCGNRLAKPVAKLSNRLAKPILPPGDRLYEAYIYGVPPSVDSCNSLQFSQIKSIQE
jgi:hypothetical protein